MQITSHGQKYSLMKKKRREVEESCTHFLGAIIQSQPNFSKSTVSLYRQHLFSWLVSSQLSPTFLLILEPLRESSSCICTSRYGAYSAPGLVSTSRAEFLRWLLPGPVIFRATPRLSLGCLNHSATIRLSSIVIQPPRRPNGRGCFVVRGGPSRGPPVSVAPRRILCNVIVTGPASWLSRSIGSPSSVTSWFTPHIHSDNSALVTRCWTTLSENLKYSTSKLPFECLSLWSENMKFTIRQSWNIILANYFTRR